MVMVQLKIDVVVRKHRNWCWSNRKKVNPRYNYDILNVTYSWNLGEHNTGPIGLRWAGLGLNGSDSGRMRRIER